MSLGKNIRTIRKAKKMSLTELARKSKLAISTVCDIEKGRSNPSLGSLDRIAKALGVTTIFLMENYVDNVINDPTGTE